MAMIDRLSKNNEEQDQDIQGKLSILRLSTCVLSLIDYDVQVIGWDKSEIEMVKADLHQE